jgi:hypothetical protein
MAWLLVVMMIIDGLVLGTTVLALYSFDPLIEVD